MRANEDIGSYADLPGCAGGALPQSLRGSSLTEGASDETRSVSVFAKASLCEGGGTAEP